MNSPTWISLRLMEEIPRPTTWDAKKPVNNGINYLSTGAGFRLMEEIRRSPVEGTVVYPIIYDGLKTSKRWLGMGFQPSIVAPSSSSSTGNEPILFLAPQISSSTP